MSSLMWIGRLINGEGLAVPDLLREILESGDWDQSPYSFLNEQESLAELASMQRQFRSLNFIPFARRTDSDDVVGLVLRDPVFKHGQVIFVHDDAFPGVEVDESFPSLNAWAQAAAVEIAQRAERRRAR